MVEDGDVFSLRKQSLFGPFANGNTFRSLLIVTNFENMLNLKSHHHRNTLKKKIFFRSHFFLLSKLLFCNPSPLALLHLLFILVFRASLHELSFFFEYVQIHIKKNRHVHVHI